MVPGIRTFVLDDESALQMANAQNLSIDAQGIVHRRNGAEAHVVFLPTAITALRRADVIRDGDREPRSVTLTPQEKGHERDLLKIGGRDTLFAYEAAQAIQLGYRLVVGSPARLEEVRRIEGGGDAILVDDFAGIFGGRKRLQRLNAVGTPQAGDHPTVPEVTGD
jgi:hypothetical protein